MLSSVGQYWVVRVYSVTIRVVLVVDGSSCYHQCGRSGLLEFILSLVEQSQVVKVHEYQQHQQESRIVVGGRSSCCHQYDCSLWLEFILSTVGQQWVIGILLSSVGLQFVVRLRVIAVISRLVVGCLSSCCHQQVSSGLFELMLSSVGQQWAV